MAEDDVKRAIVPTAVLVDWLTYYNFKPGQFLVLTTDDPESRLVLYIRP